MRINVYTEELLWGENNDDPVAAEIVQANYISSRTGQPMTNWGLRVFLKSHPDLHYVPPRDDDRSAVTFWCGPKEKNVLAFLEMLTGKATACTLDTWREKTKLQQEAAEAAERTRPK